ncbi:2,5-diketo-D-gluconate reductase A [Methanoculleus chikugoensis]|jgi:aryl-alcohol dehydrogenase-like predicted oxidoreductase|uniref:2,5-diketo-D-gluconate reductase A n=1 Tax=Methanoculleus chikugoensis TaxID=118126 RepID=A0A1M4MNL6_9EURY|nr:aldo/keto reductase [Methanoculleus chikugoensis]MDD4566519.1 aldo/keto reductase [Methanoculleus chikugoensis]NMA09424.1 aldo/keto reductase [Methanomicrobiales archaeon]SCL76505.1 2,5-diketo-D-gluconate reductase A [Methanoculleus chikugoensis]
MGAPGRRRFGKTGREVTAVGLGGEGILRTYGRHAEANAVIMEALDQGIAYFDSAKAYAGSEDYYGEVWRNRPDLRASVFQASKSASRLHADAELDLQATLQRMGIETLDLWQIHDVRTFTDIREVEGPSGALEAFIEARESGIVRHIGVTGHHDPDVLSHAVETWPVDAVMLPVNPVEEVLGGFLDTTLPVAREQGVAVIGMKVLGGSNYLVPGAGVTPEVLVRYALSREVSIAIVGCSTPAEVQALAAAGRSGPLPDDEAAALVEAFRPHARELAYYRGFR